MPVDLSAMESGGTALGCSNMHFGHPRNLIAPGTAANMGEGWETARRVCFLSVVNLVKSIPNLLCLFVELLQFFFLTF